MPEIARYGGEYFFDDAVNIFILETMIISRISDTLSTILSTEIIGFGRYLVLLRKYDCFWHLFSIAWSFNHRIRLVTFELTHKKYNNSMKVIF